MGGGRGGFADGMPLSDWEIREEDIEICRRPDGNLWHLGAGDIPPPPPPRAAGGGGGNP